VDEDHYTRNLTYNKPFHIFIFAKDHSHYHVKGLYIPIPCGNSRELVVYIV